MTFLNQLRHFSFSFFSFYSSSSSSSSFSSSSSSYSSSCASSSSSSSLLLPRDESGTNGTQAHGTHSSGRGCHLEYVNMAPVSILKRILTYPFILTYSNVLSLADVIFSYSQLSDVLFFPILSYPDVYILFYSLLSLCLILSYPLCVILFYSLLF